MEFEYQPIKLNEPTRIESPQHSISRKPWKNKVLNKLYSLLERKLLGISDNLEIYESTYPTPIQTEYPENNVGRVRYYKASGNSAVIILPQRGRGYNFAQLIASYLATNGISTYEIEAPLRESRFPDGVKSFYDLPIDLSKLKTRFRQAVTETRGLIDLVEEENVGICGVSLGAIYASIVYGIDERVSSACLIMAGGNLVEMVFESNDKFARFLRDSLVKNGISKEELKREVEDIEPRNYAKPHKSKNLLMINGHLDKEVPLRYALELCDSWGNPEQILVSAGHLSIVVNTAKLLSKILDHYKRTLSDLS